MAINRLIVAALNYEDPDRGLNCSCFGFSKTTYKEGPHMGLRFILLHRSLDILDVYLMKISATIQCTYALTDYFQRIYCV